MSESDSFRFPAAGLHGDVDAATRQSNLAGFTDGQIGVLVATDLASRGLDLPVATVVQYEFALDATVYLHRAGRTGRNGQEGRVISLVAPVEAALAAAIEKTVQPRTSRSATPAPGNPEATFDPIFSRNRSWRKTLRKHNEPTVNPI